MPAKEIIRQIAAAAPEAKATPQSRYIFAASLIVVHFLLESPVAHAGHRAINPLNNLSAEERRTIYLESDFMNFTGGQSPYRWRQYWGQAQIGRWEILGGQAWSLLRTNRSGTASD